MLFPILKKIASGSKLLSKIKWLSIRSLKNMNVLIVEDDPEILELIKIIRKNRGWNIEIATSSCEAVSLITKRPYDILVLDWHLPDLPANEFIDISTGRFKRHFKHASYSKDQQVPVVTFTSHPRHLSKIQDSNFFRHYAHWAKPFSMATLETQMEELFLSIPHQQASN